MEGTYENATTTSNDFFGMPEIIGSDQGNGGSTEWVWMQLRWTWWVILQLNFALIGVFGNVLVLVVLFLRRKMRRSTDTLIAALAFADFLTSVFLLPKPDILALPSKSWLGQFYCRVIHPSLLLWISIVASIYTLTMISIERYVAIAHPFLFRRLFTYTRTVSYIVIIWVASFATNAYQLVVVLADNNACVVVYPSIVAQNAYGVFILLAEFVVPAITMIVAQVMTAVDLHRMSKSFDEGDVGDHRSNPTSNHILARKRVLQMLILVVTVFILCWGPDQIFFIGLNLGLFDHSLLYGPVHRAVVIFASINSCANAFIYTIRYPLFRQALKDMFFRNRSTKKPIFDVDCELQKK